MAVKSRKEWLWWILATSIGWVTFLIIFEGFSFLLFPSLIASGSLLGFGQWLVLRRHIPLARWWLLASLPGWMLTWSYLQVLQGADFIPPQIFLVMGAIGGFLGGLLGGSLQWLVLRRYIVGAIKWLFPSITGTTIGIVVFWLIYWIGLPFEGILSAIGSYLIIAAALAGIVHGCITGAGWLWLLHQPNPTPTL